VNANVSRLRIWVFGGLFPRRLFSSSGHVGFTDWLTSVLTSLLVQFSAASRNLLLTSPISTERRTSGVCLQIGR
jgi:hypothetical protein